MNYYNGFPAGLELRTNEAYRGCGLPPETERLLCDVGLPAAPVYFLRFGIDGMADVRLDDGHIIIGSDGGTNICVNKCGEIVSIDPEYECPERFVNTDLARLMKYIAVYLSYEQSFAGADDDCAGEILHRMRAELMSIDERALDDAENWWSVVLEQLELGLM